MPPMPVTRYGVVGGQLSIGPRSRYSFAYVLSCCLGLVACQQVDAVLFVRAPRTAEHASCII